RCAGRPRGTDPGPAFRGRPGGAHRRGGRCPGTAPAHRCALSGRRGAGHRGGGGARRGGRRAARAGHRLGGVAGHRGTTGHRTGPARRRHAGRPGTARTTAAGPSDGAGGDRRAGHQRLRRTPQIAALRRLHRLPGPGRAGPHHTDDREPHERSTMTTVSEHPTVARLAAGHGRTQAYAYLDEDTKRTVRRAILKALAIPGWQVPFASREMPVARGWGSGGLQVTLALVGPTDVVKVIDQGDDHSVNAAAMRDLISRSAQCGATTSTRAATIIQSRHRIPEADLRPDQILVLQVPHPEPLRRVIPDELEARRRHAAGDYSPAWLDLYDAQVRLCGPRTGADHPVLVARTRLMSPSAIPRHDV